MQTRNHPHTSRPSDANHAIGIILISLFFQANIKRLVEKQRKKHSQRPFFSLSICTAVSMKPAERKKRKGNSSSSSNYFRRNLIYARHFVSSRVPIVKQSQLTFRFFFFTSVAWLPLLLSDPSSMYIYICISALGAFLFLPGSRHYIPSPSDEWLALLHVNRESVTP